MITVLPESINSVEEAKNFLQSLYNNGEHYHPEDNAHDLIWDMINEPSEVECDQLNKLMRDIYSLPECEMKRDDERGNYMDFDPCGFLLDLDGHIIE